MLVECNNIREYIVNFLANNDNLSTKSILNCFNKNELFTYEKFVKTLKKKLIEVNSDIENNKTLPDLWISKWGLIYTELLPLIEKRLKELDK